MEPQTLDIQTLDEILGALNHTGAEIATFFGGLPGDVFFEGNDERWSPGHHLKHLVLSNRPVASALALPRERLSARDASQPHRPCSEIQARYQAALSTGARAFGPFLPSRYETQAEAVGEYRDSVALLNRNCLDWADPELGRYAMPHPVLGLLSVREMLFFTVYHNQHHLNGVKASLEHV